MIQEKTSVVQSGAYILYLVDQFSSFYALMIICLFELFAIAWIYGRKWCTVTLRRKVVTKVVLLGAERFLSDIEFMLGKRPGVAWSIFWRFMCTSIVSVSFTVIK